MKMDYLQELLDGIQKHWKADETPDWARLNSPEAPSTEFVLVLVQSKLLFDLKLGLNLEGKAQLDELEARLLKDQNLHLHLVGIGEYQVVTLQENFFNEDTQEIVEYAWYKSGNIKIILSAPSDLTRHEKWLSEEYSNVKSEAFKGF